MQKVEQSGITNSEHHTRPENKPRHYEALKVYLLPLVFYLLVAIAFTWPLVLNLGDRVMLSRGGDVWQHLWNNWWVRFSLLDLHTHPYTTPMLYYPDGANLFFHALDPMDGYLSVPFQVLFGLVTSFNLIMLFQVTIAGFGVYLLARYLAGNIPAALVAGLIYACSPLESSLLNLGQLELTSIEWLPLFILCFIKALNRDARPWLWRGLSVLFLLILSLDSWYYLLYAVIFSGLYVLYRFWLERAEWRQKWPRTLLVAAGIMVCYGILISPVLIPTLREAGSGGTTQRIFNLIYNSATIKGFFTTGPSLLWSLFGSKESDEFRGSFIGYFTLLLALLGLITTFKKGWFWGVVAAIFLVLALGPVLHFSFDYNWTPETADSGPSLPGRLLYNLPFGNIARVPLRYVLITMLSLAILAAYGLTWLSKRFERISPAKLALPALVGLLVFVEFMPGVRPLADTSIPAFYQQLAREGNWNDFAVLETPDAGTSIISRAMYYQTAHQHPMVGGYLSRKPDYPFHDFPGIKELLEFPVVYQRDILPRETLANTIGLLQYYKIRYVILHPDLLTSADARFNSNQIIQLVFGQNSRPYYQDSQLQVWRVPDAPVAQGQPDASRLLAQLDEGWSGRNEGPSGIERTVPGQARMSLFNPYSQAMPVKITVPVRPAAASVKIKIGLNGNQLTEQNIAGSGASLSFNLTLKPGLNELTFNTTTPLNFGLFNFASS
ncbi:MAG TPA: hypothetical protein VH186_16480 [Chloroflexia bacterium]|nr:hypothetical protein [Chloroflexia bacterium]